MTELLPFFRPARVQPESPSAIALRPYQAKAVEAIERELAANRSTLLVLPTGGGKTVVFSELARQTKGRVLVIGHRDELLRQAVDKLRAVTGEEVGLEQAASYGGRERIVVASIQTISRERRRGDWDPETFRLVIVDEAHHAVAASYKAVIDHFGGAKILGVTATPDRGDRLAMGKVFDSVAMVYDIADAINDGWLVPIVAQSVEIDVDLSKIKTTAGDLNQAQLDEAMGRVLEGVAHPTFELAGDRQCITFTTSVENAHKIAGIMCERRPNCAVAVDGGMDIDERRARLRGYARGDYQFLVNVMIATEGFDDPPTSCIAIGRPSKSRALIAQMIGRGLRLHPGKQDALILDYVGFAGKHSLVCPMDVLAGRYTDEEITLAKELGDKKPGERAHVLLEQARAELVERAQRKVRHTVNVFNPFEVFHMEGGDNGQMDWQFGAQEPSEKQVNALRAFNVPVPPNLTKREASRLLGTVFKRKELGLASYKQLAELQRHGVTDLNISFDRAKEALSAIWKNRGKTQARQVIDDILMGRQRPQRQFGWGDDTAERIVGADDE